MGRVGQDGGGARLGEAVVRETWGVGGWSRGGGRGRGGGGGGGR